ncbi:hypothetical protein NQZ68_009938 [Dissostichus eleginoides]|nr:hypothetical protein NQZ68_009938 [Dissostichus eleginoides]
MGIPGTNPQRFTAHRWLSAYDVGISTRRMLPAYKMFKRENVKLSTVDKALCKNIRTAGTKDKTRRKQALLKKKERQEEFGCQPTTTAEQSRKIAVEKDRHKSSQ